MFYVTDCLEEAGVIFVCTASDKDVAKTLIILIDDTNSSYNIYNSLDSCDQNLRLLRIFSIPVYLFLTDCSISAYSERRMWDSHQ